MTSSSPEITGFDRRTHRRVQLCLPAELSASGSTWAVEARDISMGGIGLSEDVALPPGARVEVELRVGDERVRAEAEVVARTGVRFTQLDQRALTRILRIVSLG